MTEKRDVITTSDIAAIIIAFSVCCGACLVSWWGVKMGGAYLILTAVASSFALCCLVIGIWGITYIISTISSNRLVARESRK